MTRWTRWLMVAMVALMSSTTRAQTVFVGPLAPDAAVLDEVRVSVNGIIRRIAAGETTVVTRGDRVTVMDAALKNRDIAIQQVNLTGFPGRWGGRPDDRGLTARTDRDLISRFAIKDAPPETFAIVASSYGIEHGRVLLRVVAPELRAIVLRVNGVSRRAEVGAGIEVRASDVIKIESVETTVPGNRDVTFRMSKASDDRMTMTVSYRGAPFGEMPVRVVR